MSKRQTLRSATSASLLGLIATGLCWADWRLFSMPIEVPAAVRAAPAETGTAAPQVAVTLALPTPDLASFSVIHERPLFLAGRRYAEAGAAEQVSPAVGGVPEFRLSGIMLQDGDARALLATSADEPSEWLRQGQTSGGWTIGSIRSGTVELTRETSRITVELYTTTEAQAGAQP